MSISIRIIRIEQSGPQLYLIRFHTKPLHLDDFKVLLVMNIGSSLVQQWQLTKWHILSAMIDKASNMEHRSVAPQNVMEKVGPLSMPCQHDFIVLQSNVAVLSRESLTIAWLPWTPIKLILQYISRPVAINSAFPYCLSSWFSWNLGEHSLNCLNSFFVPGCRWSSLRI